MGHVHTPDVIDACLGSRRRGNDGGGWIGTATRGDSWEFT